MDDVFPSKKSEFVDFIRRFSRVANDSAGDYGFSPEEIEAMQEEFSEITSVEEDLGEQRTRYKAQKTHLDTLIKNAKRNYRRRIRRVRADENVTDEKLAKIGLKPRDESPTIQRAPATAPMLLIINGARLRHRLKFWEEGSARMRRKPKGVIGAEVWRKIVGVDENLRLIGLATRSPHLIEYDSEDVGKQVEYEIAWITRRGERSELSQTRSATITG